MWLYHISDHAPFASQAALPGDVFSIFIDLLAAFFFSLLLLTSRMRIRDFVLSLTHPDHRRRTGLILDRIWLRLGRYLWAQVLVMAIVGVLTYVSLIAISAQLRGSAAAAPRRHAARAP